MRPTLVTHLFRPAALLLALGVAGCASPTLQARDAARLTAAQVSLLQSELAEFADNQKRVTEHRVASHARFGRAIAELQSDNLTYFRAVADAAEMAGQEKGAGLHRVVRLLRDGSDDMAAQQANLRITEVDARTAIERSLETYKAPKKDLSEIAKSLGQLSTRNDWGTEGRILFSFFKDIYDDLKELKKQSDQATADSEAAAKAAGTAR